jgi:hypothetical protein
LGAIKLTFGFESAVGALGVVASQQAMLGGKLARQME